MLNIYIIIFYVSIVPFRHSKNSSSDEYHRIVHPKRPGTSKSSKLKNFKRKLFNNNVKQTQTDNKSVKESKTQTKISTKTAFTSPEPFKMKTAGFQTIKIPSASKNIQTKEEKRNLKLVNQFSQTLFDAEQLEKLKKEIARLKGDAKIEEIQNRVNQEINQPVRKTMPSTSKIAVVEKRRASSHSSEKSTSETGFKFSHNNSF